MLILDTKTGEVREKDIKRPECPFRSITDRKLDLYPDKGEFHVKGKTKTQAEQYVPMIKMIERMLRGEDVELIREMYRPLDLSTVKTEQDLDALMDSIPDDDLDPSDLMNLDLSTETQAEQPIDKASEASSSSGSVASNADDQAETVE